MHSVLVPSMLGFVIDPTSPQMLWADAYSCFDWQNNYAILCSENSSENRKRRTNSGKQTEINAEAQRYKIPFVSAQLLWISALLWCVSHLQALEEAGNTLQPPQHLLIFFLPFTEGIILISCPVGSGSQPAFPFSRRNSVAVEGVCTKHGELTSLLYPNYAENPSPCCTSTLTSGDNFSFSAH